MAMQMKRYTNSEQTKPACGLLQVLLSEAHPGLQGLLTGAVGYVLLAVVLASAVSLAAGLLVAPSLATDEVSG